MGKNKHGFTLIEIVVAISVLLAGIVPIINGLMFMLQRHNIDEKAIALVADIDNCVYNTWDTKTIPVTKKITKGENSSGGKKNIYSITRPDSDSKFSAKQSNTDVLDIKDNKLVLMTVGVYDHYTLPDKKQAVAFCYKLQQKKSDKK